MTVNHVQAFLAADQDWHVHSALSANATFNYLAKESWTHLAQQTIQMLKSSQILNKVVLTVDTLFVPVPWFQQVPKCLITAPSR